MNQEKLMLQKMTERLGAYLQTVKKYRMIIFIVFVGLIYAFVFYRANSLNSSQPSADQVSGQVKAARIPHIDQSVVQQLQSLKDNHVSVKALFNQARSNPFQ